MAQQHLTDLRSLSIKKPQNHNMFIQHCNELQYVSSFSLHTMLATILPTQFQVLCHSTTHDENIRITYTCPSVWLSL